MLISLCFVVAAAVEILCAVRTIVPDWLEILTVLVSLQIASASGSEADKSVTGLFSCLG